MIWLDKFIAYEHMNKLQAVCFWSIVVPLFEVGAFLVHKFEIVYLIFAPFLILLLLAFLYAKEFDYGFFITYVATWLFCGIATYFNAEMKIRFYIPMWFFSIFILMAIAWVYLYNKDCLIPETINSNEYLVFCTLMHKIDDYLFNLTSEQDLYNYAKTLLKHFKCTIPNDCKNRDILFNHEGLTYWENNKDLIGRTSRVIIAAFDDTKNNNDELLYARNVLAHQLKRKEISEYSLP